MFLPIGIVCMLYTQYPMPCQELLLRCSFYKLCSYPTPITLLAHFSFQVQPSHILTWGEKGITFPPLCYTPLNHRLYPSNTGFYLVHLLFFKIFISLSPKYFVLYFHIFYVFLYYYDSLICCSNCDNGQWKLFPLAGGGFGLVWFRLVWFRLV